MELLVPGRCAGDLCPRHAGRDGSRLPAHPEWISLARAQTPRICHRRWVLWRICADQFGVALDGPPFRREFREFVDQSAGFAVGRPGIIIMNVLGISAFYHDSAAALVSDGKIIAAVQEE